MPTETTSDAKQVVNRYLDALTAGDIEAVRDCFAENATWTIMADLPFSGPWRGRDAIIDEFMGDLGGRLFQAGNQSFEFEPLVAEGPDVVLEWRFHARTAKGAEYNNRYCNFFVVRDGRIVEVREYVDSAYVERVLL
jgi:uncharacterized protein